MDTFDACLLMMSNKILGLNNSSFKLKVKKLFCTQHFHDKK